MQNTVPFILLAVILGCGEPATSDLVFVPAADQEVGRDSTLDSELPDALLPDLAPDAASSPVDAGPPDAEATRCDHPPSRRADPSLRTDGCRFISRGTIFGTVLRGVVLSGDGLDNPLGTSLHESSHFVELRLAGADLVWLLGHWRGVEPFEGQYDGAYMRRLCVQGKAAKDAGLAVVLGIYQEGVARGLPTWLRGPPGTTRASTWSRIWREKAEKFVTMWSRLIATCQAVGLTVDGLQPLTAPSSDDPQRDREIVRGLFERIHQTAEAAFGPILYLLEPLQGPESSAPLWLDEPDQVYAPAVWPATEGPEAGPDVRSAHWEQVLANIERFERPTFIRGVASLAEAGPQDPVQTLEEMGLSMSIWQDGFVSPFSLRDEEGMPQPEWHAYFDRPWPQQYGGHLHGFGRMGDVWWLEWTAQDPSPSVFEIKTGHFAPPHAVSMVRSPDVDLAYDFDPARRILTIFIDGAIGHQRMAISGEWPNPGSME